MEIAPVEVGRELAPVDEVSESIAGEEVEVDSEPLAELDRLVTAAAENELRLVYVYVDC